MSLRRQGVAVEAAPNIKRDPTGKAANKSVVVPVPAAPKEDDKARKRREAEARQKKTAKLGPLEKTVAQLEERVGVLEAEQKTRGAELSDPSVYDDAARRNKLLDDYQKAAEKLDELNARWESAMAELETARAELAADQA
jgi:ATP-binding cassette subfamily F protein 3